MAVESSINMRNYRANTTSTGGEDMKHHSPTINTKPGKNPKKQRTMGYTPKKTKSK